MKSAREFFKSFESLNFNDLSVAHIQKLVDAHKSRRTRLAHSLLKKASKPEVMIIWVIRRRSLLDRRWTKSLPATFCADFALTQPPAYSSPAKEELSVR